MRAVRWYRTITAFTISLTATAAGQTTWHVDDDAPPGGDGTTWQTAFRFLQDAMAADADGDTVRVAQGTYRPDRSEENPEGTGNRFARFLVNVEIDLLGGFAGLGAENPDARDFTANETLLSGDLAGDDDGSRESMKENSQLIVWLSEESVLCEGFTITAANGRHGMEMDENLTLRSCVFAGNVGAFGAGLAICEAGTSGLVVDCTFVDNWSETTGGGLAVEDLGPRITDCLFVGNSALAGGAVASGCDSTVRLEQCTFVGNEARTGRGGAVYEELVTFGVDAGIFGAMTDCVFIGNRAATTGGAISETNGRATAENCVFIGNHAGQRGGVAAVTDRGLVALINCTATGNTAGLSGGAVRNTNGDVAIDNSILWGNEPGEIDDLAGTAFVRFSNIEGGWSGAGRDNIDVDPRFVLPPDPGPDDEWGTEDDDLGDLDLAANSPCVDAARNNSLPGDISVDVAGRARFVDVPGAPDTGEGERPLVDMGAYEHQVLACAQCTADLDCDDAVTADDLCLWYRAPCDVDRDGRTDEQDAALIAALVEEAFDDCNANGIPDACEGLPLTGGLTPAEAIDPETVPAVAIGDDLAMLGAHLDDEAGDNAGAVFLFQRDGGAWSPLYKIPSPEGKAGAQYGRSVALDGSVAVVGAFRDDENGTNAGAAYVYRHKPYRLVSEGKLLAEDGATGDRLGRTVAASTRVVIAGAHRVDDRRGAAYVFRRDGGVWTQEAKLVAAIRGVDDRFGYGVAIDDDLALVGADRQDDNGEDAGAAFVFRFDGVTWMEEQQLLAPDGESGDAFGEAVAIDGDVAAVGAYGDDDRATNAGAVWVFRYDADQLEWIPEQKLTAPAGAAGDWYGRSVALAGGELLVGAQLHDGGGADSGGIYVYRATAGAWRLVAHRAGAAGAMLGWSVDLGAGSAIAGSPGDPDYEAQLVSLVGAPDRNDNEVPDDCECLGDVDGDGEVRFDDLVLLLAAWGPCEGDCPEDLDRDEKVGFEDLLLLLAAWGPCS